MNLHPKTIRGNRYPHRRAKIDAIRRRCASKVLSDTVTPCGTIKKTRRCTSEYSVNESALKEESSGIRYWIGRTPPFAQRLKVVKLPVKQSRMMRTNISHNREVLHVAAKDVPPYAIRTRDVLSSLFGEIVVHRDQCPERQHLYDGPNRNLAWIILSLEMLDTKIAGTINGLINLVQGVIVLNWIIEVMTIFIAKRPVSLGEGMSESRSEFEFYSLNPRENDISQFRIISADGHDIFKPRSCHKVLAVRHEGNRISCKTVVAQRRKKTCSLDFIFNNEPTALQQFDLLVASQICLGVMLHKKKVAAEDAHQALRQERRGGRDVIILHETFQARKWCRKKFQKSFNTVERIK